MIQCINSGCYMKYNKKIEPTGWYDKVNTETKIKGKIF